MQHHILVPVNFSDYSLNAGKYAVRLASQLDAKITLLHAYHIPVIDPVMSVDLLSTMADDLNKETALALDKMIQQLKEYAAVHHLSDVEIQPYPVLGLAVDEITEAVHKKNCDMIVLGRRRAEEMAKALMGSITSTVVGRASVPVLVVPESVSPDVPVTDVLYASQLDPADKKWLSKLLALTGKLKAKVHCLHINTDDGVDKNIEQLLDLAKNYSAEQAEDKIEFVRTDAESVKDALAEYLDKHPISVLTMLTHKRTFFAKLFDPSLTKRIALNTNVPLLVYHDKQAG